MLNQMSSYWYGTCIAKFRFPGFICRRCIACQTCQVGCGISAASYISQCAGNSWRFPNNTVYCCSVAIITIIIGLLARRSVMTTYNQTVAVHCAIYIQVYEPPPAPENHLAQE